MATSKKGKFRSLKEKKTQKFKKKFIKNWALLVSGSHGYIDYRHEDYYGENAMTANLIAVILGDMTMTKGGSGKVIHSGPNDRIFFFYSGHGNELKFQMPSPRLKGFLSKTALTAALRKKYAIRGYKSMIIYVNSCLAVDLGNYIRPDMSIYIVTCGAPGQNCLATYCNKEKGLGPPYPPDEYNVCVASQFGAAWTEHTEQIDTTKISLQKQYEVVRKRVTYSNVTQRGNLQLAKQKVSTYLGSKTSAHDFGGLNT